MSSFEASGSIGDGRTGSVDTLYPSPSDVAEPPKKRRKTNNTPNQQDDKAVEDSPRPPNIADLRMVLEQAGVRNIFAVAEDEALQKKIVKGLLDQNSEAKKRRVPKDSIRASLCLLVLSDDETVGRSVAEYVRSGDFASVGTYTASMAQADGTPHSQWFRLAQNDVAIISIECLLDSLRCRTLTMSQIHSIVVSDPLPFSDAIAELGRFTRAADTHSRPRISAVIRGPGPGEKIPKTYSRVELYLGAKLLQVTHAELPRPPTPPPSENRDLEKKAAVASTSVFRYSRKKPDFWANIPPLPSRAGRLYPTIVSVGDLNGAHHAPILILTREPIPDLPSFTVFSTGLSATVQLKKAAPLDYNEEQLTALYGYTVRVCRVITNKPFSCSVDSLPYLVAPLSNNFNLYAAQQDPSVETQVDEHIPWDAVQVAADDFIVPLVPPEENTSRNEFAADAVVQDRRAEFTNRYFITKIRRDLTPLSKAEDSMREAEYANFLEYCADRIKDFQGLKNNRQPMVEVEVVPAMINHLNPTLKPTISAAKFPAKYLIPELCHKLTVPASVLRTALMMPSIMRRVDELLIVKELNMKLFSNSIHDDELLAALTSPAALAERDYERLELLGDAFLKYVASTYLFVTMPSAGEGDLHMVRQDIVSNQALLLCANELGLPTYILSKSFVTKLWEPLVQQPANEASTPTKPTTANDGEPPPAKRSKKQRQKDEQDFQWIGDKTVADVVEAIIGAAFLSGGQNVALKAMKTLNIAIPSVEQWSDFARINGRLPPPARNFVPLVDVKALEAIVRCEIKNRDIFAQALTHSSVHGPGYNGYERLEFLGDAILDFLVARYVFDSYPALSPAGLSLIKSAMISNETLAAFCVDVGLYSYFRHASPEVGSAISAYVDKINKAKRDEYASAEREGRLPGQYWLNTGPPKALSDIVESIVGGLYISDDFAESGVVKFFDTALKPFYDRHIRMQTLSLHPTSTLFDLLYSYGCQQHQIVKEEDAKPRRCDVVVHDVILASAEDHSIASASRLAAAYALDALDGDPEFMARTCDCRATQQSSKKTKKTQKAQLGYE
ncbi:ribonuclease III [Daedalea quercina L-15889]|uniref:Ribonuclease III n=1 Tax=Daedalea quercina L-15889 TaxID=1314783 RepID=A0A165U5Z1_9APHY|nr:ribonuclease III [Daedalea quercina L-15889]